MGYYKDGLDIEDKKPVTNIFGQQLSNSPNWSKNHPFHWVEAANRGGSEAMYQLGLMHHINS